MRPHNPITARHLLPACLVFLLAAAAAWSQEPQHAAGGPSDACLACHTRKDPSPQDHSLRSCLRAGDAALKSPEAVESAPDVFILSELSEIYVPVVFPHKLHASMEAMADGCGVCHHHGDPGKTPRCSSCHEKAAQQENLSQPSLKGAYHRQCLGCHQEWKHTTDCMLCHAKRVAGNPEPALQDATDITGRLHPNVEVPQKKVYPTAGLEEGSMVTFHHKDHAELFGLRCVDCHRKENCSRCHDAAAPRAKHVRQDPHEDCIKCHKVDGECGRCHSQEEFPSFSHERRTGFALPVFHQGLACKKCHTADGPLTKVSRDCGACHAPDWFPASFDHSKTGLTLNENHADADCAGCHVKGLGQPPQCDSCHDDTFKYPDRSPGSPAKPTQESNLKAVPPVHS